MREKLSNTASDGVRVFSINPCFPAVAFVSGGKLDAIALEYYSHGLSRSLNRKGGLILETKEALFGMVRDAGQYDTTHP